MPRGSLLRHEIGDRVALLDGAGFATGTVRRMQQRLDELRLAGIAGAEPALVADYRGSVGRGRNWSLLPGTARLVGRV